MTAGRPPKPVEQKRAIGNPGKRPLPDARDVVVIPAALETPAPNRKLFTQGQAFWDKVWEIGGLWISPTTDYEIMLMTAEMIDERGNLRAKVLTDGSPKDRRALRELERAITGNLAQLGLNPAERTRLGLAEVKRQSKLAELKGMRNDV
tara:strand:- start:867 stop:1313 length:447 start_codon:yes stop_codon:yes gene_type:complete